MSGAVLVLNSGSSSIKYQLVDPRTHERLTVGAVEQIGEGRAHLVHRVGDTAEERSLRVADHAEALRAVLALFDEVGPVLADVGIIAVGHRVVMGGDRYDEPVLVDDEVEAAIEALAPLAPLHNPPNLAGIRVARALLPEAAHVAVFDTAFFSGLPPAARTYAIDRHVAAVHGIRRYGFHGTSHRYVSRRAAEVVGRDLRELRQVVLHLGNGASASAIAGGVPVDTSMGLTPLEGLVMGTRPGDLDPGVLLHLARAAHLGIDDLDHLLNKRSGLKGLTGHNDMRDVRRLAIAGDADARVALDVYVHRLKKYVGAFAAVLGGLDVLTFTAGIGEHDAAIRAEACAGLGFLGIEVDPERNEGGHGARRISPDDSPVAVLVVPTDEELAITLDAVALLGG